MIHVKPLSIEDVHVKFLLADYKAIFHHMTVKACASPETLPIPFELGSQTGYLLSSSLSAAVKLFTNCKGTTVPYFFITLSIYVFITLEISCTFMLLYQLNTIISYTSIVLLHS